MTYIIRLFMLLALALAEYLNYKLAFVLFKHSSSSAFDLAAFLCFFGLVAGLYGLVGIFGYKYQRGEV